MSNDFIYNLPDSEKGIERGAVGSKIILGGPIVFCFVKSYSFLLQMNTQNKNLLFRLDQGSDRMLQENRLKRVAFLL